KVMQVSIVVIPDLLISAGIDTGEKQTFRIFRAAVSVRSCNQLTCIACVYRPPEKKVFVTLGLQWHLEKEIAFRIILFDPYCAIPGRDESTDQNIETSVVVDFYLR